MAAKIKVLSVKTAPTKAKLNITKEAFEKLERNVTLLAKRDSRIKKSLDVVTQCADGKVEITVEILEEVLVLLKLYRARLLKAQNKNKEALSKLTGAHGSKKATNKK